MADQEIVIYITSANIEEAHKIADVLLTERKVACVNMIPGIKSYFWWQGKRESTPEVFLMAKSRASLFPAVMELVRKNHSYEIPEIIALPILAGSQDYLNWIREETKEDVRA